MALADVSYEDYDAAEHHRRDFASKRHFRLGINNQS